MAALEQIFSCVAFEILVTVKDVIKVDVYCELLIFLGVKHPNIICDTCKTQGIQGMRWKCTKCHDFDLCGLCYMADKHDLAHSFQRFDTASSKG